MWRKKSSKSQNVPNQVSKVIAELSELNQIVSQLYRLGLTSEAIPVALYATKLAADHAGSGSIEHARCLYNLATLYYTLKNYKEASYLCEQVLNIARNQADKCLPEFFDLARNLRTKLVELTPIAESTPEAGIVGASLSTDDDSFADSTLRSAQEFDTLMLDSPFVGRVHFEASPDFFAELARGWTAELESPMLDNAFGGLDEIVVDDESAAVGAPSPLPAPVGSTEGGGNEDPYVRRTSTPNHDEFLALNGVVSVRGPEELAKQEDVGTRPVDCSVFAPPVIAATDQFMVQVFVHEPKQTDEARDLATEFDSKAERRGRKSLGIQIENFTKLDIDLSIKGLHVDDPVQSLIWTGRTEAVQFGVNVPEQCRQGDCIATVGVSSEGIPLGHIKFKISVVARAPDPLNEPELRGDEARVYKRAFISYSSEDRHKVLPRVQMLRATGISYFQDVLDLDPGARWEKELYRHIDEADLFLLFWSENSKKSNWVRREALYALQKKRGDEYAPPEIRPVLIEGPPVPAPWDELAHLHFNDKLVHFINL